MSRGRKRGRKKDQSFFSMSVQVVCGSLLSFYSTNKEETLVTKYASLSHEVCSALIKHCVGFKFISLSSLVNDNTRIC